MRRQTRSYFAPVLRLQPRQGPRGRQELRVAARGRAGVQPVGIGQVLERRQIADAAPAGALAERPAAPVELLAVAVQVAESPAHHGHSQAERLAAETLEQPKQDAVEEPEAEHQLDCWVAYFYCSMSVVENNRKRQKRDIASQNAGVRSATLTTRKNTTIWSYFFLAVEHENKLNTRQSVAEVMSGLRRFNGILASIMNVEYVVYQRS